MAISFVRVIIMLLWIFFYYFSGIQQSTIHYLLHKNCWPDFFSSPLTFLSPSLPAFLLPLYPSSFCPPLSHSFFPPPPIPFPITPERHTVGHPLKKAGHISYLRRLKSTVLLCTWKFFPNSACSHWLLRGHVTSNNEKCFPPKSLSGQHCNTSLARFIFINLCTKKFFLVGYITNHWSFGKQDQSLSVYYSLVSWYGQTRLVRQRRFTCNEIDC